MVDIAELQRAGRIASLMQAIDNKQFDLKTSGTARSGMGVIRSLALPSRGRTASWRIYTHS